jgi:hypothetical protein
MTRVDLEAAELMLDEATPGPWHANRHGEVCFTLPSGLSFAIADVYGDAGPDRDLIVAAPTLIRALIEEVRGSKETIEQLTRERDEALVMLDARRKCQVIAEAEIERVRGQRDEAHRRGMREGVALAKAKFRRRLGSSPGIGPMEFDDWSEVDAELVRRMSIPRASAAPSDKLSEEEL